MKCVGGPMDGLQTEATSRYLEAMAEDAVTIARYELIGGEYRLIGYWIPVGHDGHRFEPVAI